MENPVSYNKRNELGPAIHRIKHPVRLIFTGRSTMGKTTLAVDLICNSLFSQVRRCFAVCPTFWTQPALKPLRDVEGAFKKKHVFTQVSDQVFDYIYQQIVKKPAPTLIFIDDAAAEVSTNKGNKGSFSRLCIACNHIDTSMIGIFQRLSSASPALRDNAEGLISFVPTKIQDVQIIYNEFNPAPANIKSKEVVYAALLEAWKNARFCFIWREAYTGKIYYFIGFKQVIRF